jgi:sterol desaturase/sphingolipid hydroxylase (fatty acid hydroxylase superfamily)
VSAAGADVARHRRPKPAFPQYSGAVTSAQIIVLATPFFLGLIALELAIGLARGRNTYRLHDALSSIGLGMLSQLFGLFTKLLAIGIYTASYEHIALFRLPVDSISVWVGALLMYDLCYYWLHRAGHRVGIFWAAHVVHHQSEDYNLSTALRQTSSGALLGWIFYLPMAVVGVPPLVFGTVALIDLLYQFWVHTQQIGRLGWFDRWFCSPSNHRVHHAVNDRYLDRNYGGILIVWDRLFGTFHEENDDEPCVYGTRAPLRSFNPLWANVEVYAALARDAWRARSWSDKLRVWFMPPGWRPADVAERYPKTPFRLDQVQRYDPMTSGAVQMLALSLFVVMLGGVCWLLWHAHELSMPTLLGATALVVAGLWIVGRLGEGRTEPAAMATAG